MVYCGTIVAIKGYSGNVVVSDLQPDVPPLHEGMRVNIGYSEQFSREFVIESWKTSKLKSIAKIKNIDTDNSAKELKEMGIFADKEDLRQIDENFIALDEIIGCQVIDTETKNVLGEILEVWETPANKVWLIEYQEREVTIPVIDDVVISLDIKNKKAEIKILEGLLDI